MRIKCEYCGHYIDDADAFCGNCGAPNDNMMRSANGVPKTIEELQDFCKQHNLPLKQMRFFIGEDYKEPRAIGIYLADDGDYVVYKNKADGSRAIRYEGKDQAYAVNEVYQKLKSEMTAEKQLRRSAQGTPHTPPPRKSGGGGKKVGKGCLIGCLAAVIILVALIVIGLIVERIDPGRYSVDPNSGSSYGQSYGSGSNHGSIWGGEDDDDYDYDGGSSSWLWDDDDDSDSSWDSWDSWDDDWDSSDWDWDSGSDWSGGGSDWDSDW